MVQPVQTHLSKHSAPFEWAVSANNLLFTAQVPMLADGKMETGSIAEQTKVTLENLKRTVQAAGGTLSDVAQVLVYLSKQDDYGEMNVVYQSYFSPPYPNRATFIAGLVVPNMRIEIIAYAHIPKKD